VLLAALSIAWIPDADRIRNAFAKENRESGRATPLELRVELRFEGDTEAAAQGILVADPSGSVRLELESPRGFVERHLRVGSRSRATRDGLPLESPRTFLPPFQVLQAATSGDLNRELAELGVAAHRVDLGYEEAHDCYVLGGRSGAGPHPSLWLDQETLSVVRLDDAEGAAFWFGPDTEYDGLRVPAWIEVRAPGEPAARLVVLGAAPATVAPGAFDASWLTPPRRPGPEGMPGRGPGTAVPGQIP
jgi:hypothetical protein